MIVSGRIPTAVVLLTFFAANACGQDFEFTPVDALWAFNAGLDWDDDGSYIVNGGVSYLPNEKWLLALNLGGADARGDSSKLESKTASVLADYSFGPVGITASSGWYDDDVLANRFGFGGSIYIRGRGFRIALSAEDWQSEFESFRFSGRIDRPEPLPPLQISSQADCDIDNTMVGASASYFGESFGVYASLRDYDYAKPECRFEIFVGDTRIDDLSRLVDAAPDLFNRIARGTLRLTRLRLLRGDSAFLEQSVAAGLSWTQGKLVYGLDYFHSEEVFTGLAADTAYGRILFPMGNSTDLEIRLGISDSDQQDKVAFIGATVFLYLGGT